MSNLSEPQTVVVAPARVSLLTTKQAAEALQVSERTIFNLLSSGQLPSINIGRSRRIRVDAIEEFAKNGAVTIAKTVTQPSLEDLAGFVAELGASGTTLGKKFAKQLSRVLTAHMQYLSGERFNAEQLRKHCDAAYSLAEEHIARHDRNRADGQPWTDLDKRVSRSLNAATASFDLALDEQEQTAA